MNGNRTVRTAAWRGLLALFLVTAGLAAEPPLPPKPAAYFNDNAGIVSAEVASRLNHRLEDFERETTNQILVAIYPKLPDGTFLEDYTIKTAEFWGTGQKKAQNGLILFVFVNDRKMRIEVGKGLESVVPDGLAGTIIRQEIEPSFKSADYTVGLERGLDAIFQATKGEYHGVGLTHAEEASHTGLTLPLWIIIAFIIVFFIWSNMGDTVFQRSGRSVMWGALNLALSASSGRGGGGYSGGSFGGGGYSGGGGSFGGGGASGSW